MPSICDEHSNCSHPNENYFVSNSLSTVHAAGSHSIWIFLLWSLLAEGAPPRLVLQCGHLLFMRTGAYEYIYLRHHVFTIDTAKAKASLGVVELWWLCNTKQAQDRLWRILEDGLSVVHSSVRQFCVYRCRSVVLRLQATRHKAEKQRKDMDG